MDTNDSYPLVVTRRAMWVLSGLTGAWVILGAALRWDQLNHLQDWRWRTVLTLAGLAVGTGMCTIHLRGRVRFPRTSRISLIGIILSQACYILLVWTTLNMHSLLWRLWFLSLIVAATATHIVWLRIAAADDRRTFMRFTIGCALASAAMLAGWGLRPTLLGMPPGWFVGFFCVPAALSILGSWILWRRRIRQSLTHRAARAVRIGWLLIGQTALIAAAFLMGRWTAPIPSVFENMPSALAGLTTEQIDAQVRNDFQRLKTISTGLDEHISKSAADFAALRARMSAQKRDVYLPEEDDRLHSEVLTYLAYRAALLRMVATYAGFNVVRDPETRARCILIAYTAGMTLMDAGTRIVALHKDDVLARRKLNEGDPAHGIPAGVFDQVYANLLNPRNTQMLAEIGGYYAKNAAQWKLDSVFPPDQMDWLAARTARAAADIRARSVDGAEARFSQLIERARKDAYEPVYQAQSILSTWIGDTKLVQWEPLISIEQIKLMQEKLQPGDILLERRNWFLSNAFLPGFWPHGALYIGTPEQMAKLGLLSRSAGGFTGGDPDIRAHLADYLKSAHDGEAHTVIESISEGVMFNSLTDSMHADYVAVLRPRLTDAQKARAIARAFSHVGKPYDFEFDFFSSDKLVCTELVYRSYEGLIHFELVKVAGRTTLPALEIARKFDNERASSTRELDFVLFLDGIPAKKRAQLADEKTFCETIKRPQGFNE